MEHAFVLVVLICVYAIRDAQVLANTRLQVLRISFLIYASILVLALLLVSTATKDLDVWQYWHLLRTPAIWLPCLVYHVATWLMHRRSVRTGSCRLAYAIDALPMPILIIALGALVHSIGGTNHGSRQILTIAGLWLGIVSLLTLVLRRQPFVEETLTFAWEMSENSNVFALLLVPFERFF